MSISRRDFLKTATVGAAGVAAVGALAGCASQSGEPAASADWMPQAWDYETDCLVIGYGGAGVWTALTAADEGQSEVLILEKAPMRGGGNTSMNNGEFAIPKDVDGAVEYITNFSNGLTPESIARTWAEEAMRNGEYADRWGFDWFEQETSEIGSSCEYPFLPGAESMSCARMEGLGIAAFEILDEARADLGIEVLFSCHDEELIQNPETKEIVGCYTYIGDDEARKAIKARKGVMMAMGGFEFNQEMQRNYLRCYPALGFYGWTYNTGDGFAMAEKVGAKLQGMDNMIGHATAYFFDNEINWGINLKPQGNSFIMVNRLGARYKNEKSPVSPHVTWHDYITFDDKICDFDRVPTWYVCDQATFDAGKFGPQRSDPGVRGHNAPGLPDEVGGWEGWSDDNKLEVEKGWIKTGNTIEELVEQMRKVDPGMMDAATLQASVDRYNQLCETGEDEDFGRNPETLSALSQPPYYAWPIYPGGCSTLGGPKHNESSQTLDAADVPIPRLYNAGSFGNMARHTYGITGGNNAENMVWGRIGARHMCALDPWDAKVE